MRIRTQTSHLPLVWRACLALNGEEDPQAIEDYLRAIEATLEKMSRETTDEEGNRELGLLRIFIRVLRKVMSPEGGSRAALVLQKPRGRPGLSMADIQRRQLAVNMVNDLVARGEKKDWSVIDVSKRMGISRSELYRWMKFEREFHLDAEEFRLE